jgi:hypothetical protein
MRGERRSNAENAGDDKESGPDLRKDISRFRQELAPVTHVYSHVVQTL